MKLTKQRLIEIIKEELKEANVGNVTGAGNKIQPWVNPRPGKMAASGTNLGSASRHDKKKKKKKKKKYMGEAKETAIDVARRIVKDKQYEQGIDAQTANLIMKIYHA